MQKLCTESKLGLKDDFKKVYNINRMCYAGFGTKAAEKNRVLHLNFI